MCMKMENVVLVKFEQQVIYVNKEGLNFSFTREHIKNLPTDVDVNEIIEIWWNVDGQCSYQIKGASAPTTFGEEHYNDYVKPYIDSWYAEKNRLAEEDAQAQVEYEKYENRKIRAFDYVDRNYNTCLDKAPVVSALGYENAINTSNLSVLMASKFTLDAGTVDNMTILDYNNLPRGIDKIQAGLIIGEIAQAQSHIKDQRKQFHDLINDTTDNATLNDALKKCVFTSLDFSPAMMRAPNAMMRAPKMHTIKELEINQIDILSEIDKRNVNM